MAGREGIIDSYSLQSSLLTVLRRIGWRGYGTEWLSVGDDFRFTSPADHRAFRVRWMRGGG